MHSRQANRAVTGRRAFAYLLSCSLILIQLLPIWQAQGAWAVPAAPAPPSRPGMSGSGLNVGSGETHVLNVSMTPVLNVGGDLKNQGTLYVVSTNPAVRSATVSALNIFNGPGATITTALPAGWLASFTGYSNAIANLSLTLVAAQNIINQGTISSANNLTLLAGGSIINALPQGSQSPPAVMQAVNNLNVLASSISNNGVMFALNGNANLANPAMYAAGTSAIRDIVGSNLASTLAQTININNTLGTIQALNGNINVGGSELDKASLLAILGGTMAANQINIDGGAGTVQTRLDSAVGTVNLSACSAQLGAQSGVLNLGNLNLSGDPTFYNFGDINIVGDIITLGEKLSILATGNITAANPQLISTRNPLTGQGQTIFMVAGGDLKLQGTALNNGVNLPPGNALGSGQTILVAGGRPAGGSISLGGTLIDASSNANNKDGGNVVLIAYGGLGTGGISNLSIKAGGHGTGSNGSVTLIADGTTGLNNTGISAVAIESQGGSGPINSTVLLASAVPLGAVTFTSTGAGLGMFVPGLLQSRDIILNAPGPPPLPFLPLPGAIKTDGGGDIVIKTGGLFRNQGSLDTVNSLPGKNAGDVDIKAGSIEVLAPILARGTDGSAGLPGLLPGMAGFAGQNGGNGGRISLNASGPGGITIDQNITSDAGSGGAGGAGAIGGTQQAGGMGGRGGNGGLAGQISLQTQNAPILQSLLSIISANGGNGGAGGAGGNGGAAGASFAGMGGFGGQGGLASGANTVLGRSGNGNMTFNGTMSVVGGNGGGGGSGGNGGSDTNNVVDGGAGGMSGIAAGGGGASMIDLLTTGGNIALGTGLANGGTGGTSGSGGAGGNGRNGGAGGMVQGAGDGGASGSISLSSGTGALSVMTLAEAKGGTGGSQNFAGGAGGLGVVKGGAGGTVQGAGDGAIGGMVTALTKGAISTTGTIDTTGGAGGFIFASASGGTGGNGSAGGFGGAVASGGGGARGGSISLTSMQAGVTVGGNLSAPGGIGGTVQGLGGAGGTGNGVVVESTLGAGGFGGKVGGGGSGGGGGMITIRSKTDVIATFDMNASGGNGGDVSGNAGAGGQGISTGGTGGDLLDAGRGAGGGRIAITAEKAVSTSNIYVSGGNGGGMLASAGNGGNGKKGGAGGTAMGSGAGGLGGFLDIKTSDSTPGPGVITFDNCQVKLDGGVAGSYTGRGGNGGTASDGRGGDGGAANAQGRAGKGGQITITGGQLTITPTASLSTNGGMSPGYAARSGDGGNGGGTGNGGTGGRVGNAGTAGDGGFIGMKIAGKVKIDSTGTDSVAARGGGVFDNIAVSGKGGDGGTTDPLTLIPLFGFGGAGGDMGDNGSAGNGGTINITGKTGDLDGIGVLVTAGGQVHNNYAQSGAGGKGGPRGNGGRSGNIGSNGSGGDGGSISLSTFSGNINLSPLIVPGGDITGAWSPVTGNGGDGGGTMGNGGRSGDIGNNGSGGNGGFIFLKSTFGSFIPLGTKDADHPDESHDSVTYIAAAGVIGPFAPIGSGITPGSSPTTGNGGTAVFGNGGDSGMIGHNGRAGDGGQVSMQTFAGNIVTPRGAIVVAGADGGLLKAVTGNGGSTSTGKGGSSGTIGKNSNGGNSGLIRLESTFGSMEIKGPLILRGGLAQGNESRTGNGGNATISGTGGNSGSIGNGGDGGLAGILTVKCGGTFASSEAIVADGGNAAGTEYAPRTGNGGNGAGLLGSGGNSGGIGFAGSAGGGGVVTITTTFGDIKPDRILVNGGRAGDDFFFPFAVGGDGAMKGITGNGGSGALGGGQAGRVGDAAKGGTAGSIKIDAGRSVLESVFYKADGGNGGEQLGTGGNGGDSALKNGGNGGSVGAAGNGGDGGRISITSAIGPVLLKEIGGIGGTGGAVGLTAAAKGGKGGNGGTRGGDGGSVDDAGKGGAGGAFSLKVKNGGSGDYHGNFGMNFFGGTGGASVGVGGDAGNGGTGGNGGSSGVGGSGGVGGKIRLEVEGIFTMLQGASVDGGGAGSVNGTGGKGGNASGQQRGGNGGNGGKQGNAGFGGSFVFDGGNFALDAGQFITANGGFADFYIATAGKGGDGGGAGGDGGGAGPAGSGGNAGGIKNDGGIRIIVKGDALIHGNLRANGGDRATATAFSGYGGNAGLNGGDGGNGGNIEDFNSAGAGGFISIKSVFGTVDGLGSCEVNGGNALPVVGLHSVSGSGGNSIGSGVGGNGGNVGNAPGAGDAGTISVNSGNNITLGNYQAKGGQVFGDWLPLSGSGGNAGGTRGDGGQGGRIGNAGTGGDGGAAVPGATMAGISLVSVLGDINVNQLTATGGNGASNFGGVSGSGGSQLVDHGAGGAGGRIGNNGFGGGGGSIFVSTLAGVHATADWDVSGGNVGGYSAMAGFGGRGGFNDGAGGEGGGLGDNGRAGGGGSIFVATGGRDITFDGNLTANGGSITGNYTGIAGNGGDGGRAGGIGGSTGANGASGLGGKVEIGSLFGNISTKSIFVNGGLVTTQQGQGGNGGEGKQSFNPGIAPGGRGGNGGAVGEGSDGGAGGKISIINVFGNIDVNGDLLAIGSGGGAVTGRGGDGGKGISEGGTGGAAARAGDAFNILLGGKGAEINLLNAFGQLRTTGQINANGSAGGLQGGQGGKGGDAAGAPGAKGGQGGDLRRTGNGGDAGKITIIATSSPRSNLAIDPTSLGGAFGAKTGQVGLGGSPGGQPGTVGGFGAAGATKSPVILMAEGSWDDFNIEQGDLKKHKNRRQIALRTSLSTVSQEPGEFRSAGYVESSDSNDDSMLPVSFVQPTLPKMANHASPEMVSVLLSAAQSLVCESACTADVIARAAACGTELAAGDSAEQFSLIQGELLFAPQSGDIQVAVPNGTLFIASGAKVLVDVHAGTTTVRTLHDRKSSDVRFASGASKVDVNLGRQLVVSSSSSHVSAGDFGISTRSASTNVLPNGIVVVLSEFSIASAIAHHPILQSLYQSNLKTDRKHMQQIYKNVCIITQLTASHGAFQSK